MGGQKERYLGDDFTEDWDCDPIAGAVCVLFGSAGAATGGAIVVFGFYADQTVATGY